MHTGTVASTSHEINDEDSSNVDYMDATSEIPASGQSTQASVNIDVNASRQVRGKSIPLTPVNSQEAAAGDDGNDIDDVYHPRSAGMCY